MPRGRGRAEEAVGTLQVRVRVAGSLRTPPAAAGSHTPRGRCCTPGEVGVYYPYPTE